MEASQVRTKKRVSDHGEVLTGQREVNAMLDLVKQETERIDSRFLEPACGDGNFLTAILQRKLSVVEKRYGKSQLEFERNAVLAVSSIYGIDILPDNVRDCRRRLFEIFDANYTRLFRATWKDKCRDAVRFILERNIIWGDALTLNTVGEKPGHIVFSEWSPVNGSMLKRRDFTFSELLRHEEAMQAPLFPGLESEEQLPLFSDLGEHVFIPTPVREYAPIHFMEIARVGQ
ncbi:MAG: SAM-dependent DNA methyltransferase [Candidatus Acidiferrales bacterium]